MTRLYGCANACQIHKAHATATESKGVAAMAHANDSTKEQQPNTNESTQKQLAMDKKLDEMLEPKERVNPRLLVQFQHAQAHK